RTSTYVGDLKTDYLSRYLIYDGSLFTNKERESVIYPLQLDWKMVYDDDMIKRMIQLLKNEYRKEEFELLVNKWIANQGPEKYDHAALWQIGLENLKIFKHTQDSLNKYRNREIHQGLYQYDEVGRFLRWDTIPRYYFLVDSFKVVYQNKAEDYYLNKIHFDIKKILFACYYVQDKRFIEPIIHIAENLEAFGLKYRENSIDYASEVLVKMQVEPYCSNYLRKVSLSLEEVKKKDFVNVIVFLSQTLNNQESFKELSKYLHSSAPTRAYFSEDENGGIRNVGKAYEDAFLEIEKNIENKDLQEMIHAPDFDLERDRFKVYDWMQKNYKKYKIRRIW
ncbi:MAG: hypothetical protein LBH32_01950, partial [Dysgonamonadaceae bacterium]|nr:hypothetical protein [Dysgonamonadaceae bacterium]